MKSFLPKFLFILLCSCSQLRSAAQLEIVENAVAQQLAQKLVGEGVTISNVTLVTSTAPRPVATGFFYNRGGTNIGIDSGIVLTNGRAKSELRPPALKFGLDGNGQLASATLADNPLSLGGDADLSGLVGGRATNDAVILEFDFVPLGDSIKFNYVFSSEEYPDYACAPPPNDFYDVFGFFISGPGFPVKKNIALVPGTTTEVSIHTINGEPCSLYPQYYVDNSNNRLFLHNGHTKILVAQEKVVPCQTYHLKICIADVGDAAFDSGVFLQAKSLSSNAIGMSNLTQTDPVSGLSYLVEGCATGAFSVRRPRKDPVPMIVNLSYGGTAVNGVDVQLLPLSVTIPANDSFVTVNVIPNMDGASEGIEVLKVYALAGCATLTPTDSTIIQIRDYDILSLTPDTAYICKRGSIQLNASAGYTTYVWQTDPTLSDASVRDPVATPVNSSTTYICTATVGTCNARDSVFLRWKDIEFISKADVNCRNASTGQIQVTGGTEWDAPVQYSLDGVNWQASGTFNNIPAGSYWVKMRDASCIDSISVNVAQAFPDLLISSLTTTDATCSGAPDGTITITASGGNSSYSYSIDGVNFQSSNLFNVSGGSQTVTIKDGNGCLATQATNIPLNNHVTVDAGANPTICEGTSVILPAISNAASFVWTPAATLSDATALNPSANPAVTTRYYLTATTGICTKIDSVDVFIRPAPVADAGADLNICYGKQFSLHAAGGTKFEWTPTTYFVAPFNTSSQDPDVKAVTNITYSLMVVDAFDCRSLVADQVKINVTPSVRIFAGNDTIAAMNQPLRLTVRELGTAGVTTYNWTPAFSLSDANSSSPVATLTGDQRFVVTGTTPDGCQGIDDVVVKVYKGPEIYVPSGFTPNNDGRNDFLLPVPVGIKEFKYLRVYNRWGQMIFFTKDPNKGWDGRINGADQPTGTFIWMAEAIDYKGNLVTRKGVVTIIR